MIYPSENAGLARAIRDRGCLLTEQPPGTEPVARHFPARNRIVSGLCRGVVVVKAAQRSGSLITARCALDQGREVLAVPGHPIDARAAGCNALIRDGATLVRNAADVLAALGLECGADGGTRPAGDGGDGGTCPAGGGGGGVADNSGRGRDNAAVAQPTGPLIGRPATAPRPTPRAPGDSGGPVALERRLLGLLGPSPADENELIRHLGVAAATLAPIVLSLELDGRITRLAGGKIALAV